MVVASAFDLSCSGRDDVLSLPFFSGGRPLLNDGGGNHPFCHISTGLAGSMRFRWNEENPARRDFFLGWDIVSPRTSAAVAPSPSSSPSDAYPDDAAAGSFVSVPVELIHSQVVYAVEQDGDGRPRLAAKSGSHPEALDLWRGDGVIAASGALVPVVTVADCLPVYLFDRRTGCRGVVHSGWKGTGIVLQALKLAERLYGARACDFSVAIGPHIQSCCYEVERGRAEGFASSFGPSCIVPPNRLSLVRANVGLLLEFGVPEDNILCCSDCTCCDERFGSFRRQTAGLPADMALEERLRRFTAMMAFVH